MTANAARCADPAASDIADRAALAFDIVRTRAAFDALEADWHELFGTVGKPHQVFQTFNWCWHWCNHFLDETAQAKQSLAILTARQNGRLVMVWPLVLETQGGLKQISWLGEPVSQYGDAVIDETAVAASDLDLAWQYIKRELQPDLARLRKVRADAQVSRLLARVNAVATEWLEAPYLSLSSAKSFEEYELRYSTRSRKNRRRINKRFEELGEAGFTRVRAGTAARELVRAGIVLKRASLARRGLVSAALTDARTLNFFEDVAEAKQRPAGCIISAVTSNGKVAALEVAIESKGHSATHIIVYDHEFEKISPGVLLLEKTISAAFREGTRTYDLLSPSADYKLDWADDVIDVADWAIPVSFKGKAYARVYLGLIRPKAKAAMIKLPSSLRRMMASSYIALAAV